MQQQNLISMAVSKELQTSLLYQVEQFKQQLVGRISLTTEERRSLTMMGPKSENFARLALVSMKQNAHLIPRGIDLDAAFADLEARDNLIPVLKALQSLVEEIEDTVAALGSQHRLRAHEGDWRRCGARRSSARDELSPQEDVQEEGKT